MMAIHTRDLNSNSCLDGEIERVQEERMMSRGEKISNSAFSGPNMVVQRSLCHSRLGTLDIEARGPINCVKYHAFI
jgi:hypothetical protein